MKNFRIVSWNVRGSMTPSVMDELCADSTVDLFVLSEYRIPKAGDLIAACLHAAGWTFSIHSNVPAKLKGVALFSRFPLIPAPTLIRCWTLGGHPLDQWIVSAQVPDAGLAVIGTYVPYPDGSAKEAVWRALIDAMDDHAGERVLAAGDFNSCHPADADTGIGYTTWSLQAMEAVAVDLWRRHNSSALPRDHVTWCGPNGKGNRLDYAFGTPLLTESVASVVHRHEPRSTGVSDHSQLVVDVRVPVGTSMGL
ncbi:MAG: endonuclease/exonuclease/phosphatase family protein [Gemmatimonadota bacterium]